MPKSKIHRLYETESRGLLDEELLDDVAYALYARCQSILDVTAAKRGKVRCPRCACRGRETWIARRRRARAEMLVCPQADCGWRLSWREYQKTFQRKQLNSGGALSAFSRFVGVLPAAKTARERMLAVDRLIHDFHYSLRGQPDRPTRPVCVNLIRGKLADVAAFLDALHLGPGADPALQASQERWRQKYAQTWWPDPGDTAGSDA